jgi:hypothetical protein
MNEPEIRHEGLETVGTDGSANGTDSPPPATAVIPVATVAPPLADTPVLVVSPPAEPAPPFAAPMPEALVAAAPPTAARVPETEALEERLRRLESVLTDMRKLEERLAERAAQPAEPAPATKTSAAIVEAPQRRWLPGFIDALRPTSAPAPAGARRGWLVFDVLSEAQSILHMYGDPRYRLTWSGRLVPPALLLLIMTSWIWLPGTSLMMNWMSVLYVKCADLVLAFFLFKALGREAKRYRELIPQYPPLYPPPH